MDAQLSYDQLATFYANTKRTVRSGLNNSECRGLIAMSLEAFDALPRDGGAYVTIQGLSAKRLGQLARMSESTADDVLDTLSKNKWGIIERNIKKGRNSAGDVVTDVDVIVPITLPSLPANKEKSDTVRGKRDQDRAAQTYALAKKAREMLSGIPCPECGIVGNWHVHCGNCGAELELCPEAESLLDGKTPEKPTISPVNVTDKTSVSVGITAEDSTEAGGRDVIPPLSESFPADITLTGADTIDYIVDIYPGVNFYMAKPKSKIVVIPQDDDGRNLSWQHIAPDACKRWLAAGGSVGIVGDGWLNFADTDEKTSEFIERNPDYRHALRIYRDNADRAKFGVLTDGVCATKNYKRGKHKCDRLGLNSKIIVAGTHESGEIIKCYPGRTLAKTLKEFENTMDTWADVPPSTIEPPSAPYVAHGLVSDDNLARKLIDEWNQCASNQAAVDALIRNCRHAGKDFAIRADDAHPSCMAAKDRARMYIDRGDDNKAYDDFELYCHLKALDKRAEIRNMIADYRQLHQVKA